MKRSKWKIPFINEELVNFIVSSKKSYFKTMSRSSTVLPGLVDKTVSVHNGKKFYPIKITQDHIGRKLGEFSYTRARYQFKKKKKKRK